MHSNLLYQSIGLCEGCLKLIPIEIRKAKNSIFFRKHCTSLNCSGNNIHDTLISKDADYFSRCFTLSKQIHKTRQHRKRFNMCIVEITNNCDIKCATCIANSGPGGGKVKKPSTIHKLIRSIEKSTPRPEIIMISGGEPTTHPKINEIVTRACQSKIPHCMLITNGIRISKDSTFNEKLAQNRDRLEVYLQFDSIKPKSLKKIRGADLSKVRRLALEQLEKFSIPTTLVAVIKQGVNDSEISSMIQFALHYKCVRGITFQPIRATGRHDESFNKHSDRINLDCALFGRQSEPIFV